MASSFKYGYATDCTEEEWASVSPYLTLLPDDAGQRGPDLRAVFDTLRTLMRAGTPWRLLPGDLPSRHAVYDQAQRWLSAGMFEAKRSHARLPCALQQKLLPGAKGSVMREAILAGLPLLRDVFEAGAGHRLMFAESQILVRAMLKMIDVAIAPLADATMWQTGYEVVGTLEAVRPDPTARANLTPTPGRRMKPGMR